MALHCGMAIGSWKSQRGLVQLGFPIQMLAPFWQTRQNASFDRAYQHRGYSMVPLKTDRSNLKPKSVCHLQTQLSLISFNWNIFNLQLISSRLPQTEANNAHHVARLFVLHSSCLVVEPRAELRKSAPLFLNPHCHSKIIDNLQLQCVTPLSIKRLYCLPGSDCLSKICIFSN